MTSDDVRPLDGPGGGRRNPKQLVRDGLSGAIEAAVTVSSGRVDEFVERTRRRSPEATDEELLRLLGREYTALVATTGGLAGGAAAAPGIGLPGAAAAAVADATFFSTASAIYILAVASVHGIEVTDIDRRRALLLMILAGPDGVAVVEKVAGRAGAHQGRRLVGAIPIAGIQRINRLLGPNTVTKYGTKQGILVLGKVVPFGIGAAIGAAGNAGMARLVIRNTRSAFGPLPPRPLRRGGRGASSRRAIG